MPHKLIRGQPDPHLHKGQLNNEEILKSSAPHAYNQHNLKGDQGKQIPQDRPGQDTFNDRTVRYTPSDYEPL